MSLSKVMFRFPDQTPFTQRDYLQSAIIFGATGSGKTNGSGLFLARHMLKLGGGGLILGSKPEDRQWWQRRFIEAGRHKDLLIFAPDSNLRFNWLGNLGGDAKNSTRGVMTVAETLKNGTTSTQDPFWERTMELHTHDAIEIIRQAKEDVSTANIAEFVVTAAKEQAQTKMDWQILGLKPDSPIPPDEALTPVERLAVQNARAWRNRYHNQTFKKAHDAPKTDIERLDFQAAKKTWLSEYPSMDSKLRGSINAEIMSVLHSLNTGIVRELVGTKTNVTPDIMRKGKYILVDMSEKEHGQSGRVVNTIWKYATQRAILRYRGAEPIVTIWCDEYQNVMNSHDAITLAECRSHYGNMVALTQSIPGVYASMKNQHFADALLTNFGTKIFHTLGDSKSAEYASSLCGQEIDYMMGGHVHDDATIWDEIMGKGRMHYSFSTQYLPLVQPREFMHGLRQGGGVVDGIVVRGGNFWRMAFEQERR